MAVEVATLIGLKLLLSCVDYSDWPRTVCAMLEPSQCCKAAGDWLLEWAVLLGHLERRQSVKRPRPEL